MSRRRNLERWARAACALLYVVGCGGTTRSGDSDAVADEATASEAEAREATELMRSLPDLCHRLLAVPCATSADQSACAHNARNLIEEAQSASCLPQVKAALDCVEQATADCGEDGVARSPAACAALLDELNVCISAASNWSELGCVALGAPGAGGGPEVCDVTCGTFAATCQSAGKALVCACQSGPSQGREFDALECPDATTVASACSYRDVL